MSKQYITEKELSDMTGRALQTLRNDRFNGRGFPYIKIGRSVRYDLDRILTILDRSTVKTSSFENGGGC